MRTWVRIAGGLGTALLALGALLVTLGSVPLGLLPRTLRMVHALADRERLRLSRRGPEVLSPGPPPAGLRTALTTPAVRRELGWLGVHATAGLVIGLAGVLLPVYAVQDVSVPAWWWLLPPGEVTAGFWRVGSWPGAAAVAVAGVAGLVLFRLVAPLLVRAQDAPGRRLLAPGPETDLALRVAELTATRAAALDAHAAELRRIERSLHDGTQNRLVATTVLLGAARRMLTRDPAAADELLERAQTATEQALTELRAVARGILPPILADRGLASALAGLAAGCPVPCRVAVELPGRCAASVEATAYFVVAEALTNVAKHSGASRAEVTGGIRAGRLRLRVRDDGRGGADPAGGGLTGIRGRIEAHDGTLAVTSPAGGPTTLDLELPCGS